MVDYARSSLAHDLPDELKRLRLLEALADPMSRATLDRIDIQPHWRCLDVGAGAGSVARMLVRRAHRGEVVAIDLDTRFLPTDVAGLTVRTHDLLRDELVAESFDLIHARLVLEHIPQRDEVLGKLIDALVPGGWLVIEGIDENPALSSPYPAVKAAMTALWARQNQLGTETAFARRVPRALKAAGFNSITLTASGILAGDGGAGDTFLGAMLERFAPALVQHGLAGAQEIEAMQAWLAHPDGIDLAALFLTAYGRK